MRRLEADVFPAFGHKFLDNVTPADIRKLMLAVEERGARDVAKRAHETTGQIFRYAIAHGIASRNPTADFKPKDILTEAAEENFSRVDAKELPTLLAKMVNYDGDANTRLPCDSWPTHLCARLNSSHPNGQNLNLRQLVGTFPPSA